VIPAAVKRPVKRWYFSNLLAAGVQSLRSGSVTDEDLTKLRSGWDNDGFDAKPVLLRELITALGSTTGAVLECGSGLSTIVMAAVAPARVRVSLEDNAQWAQTVTSALDRHGLRGDVRFAPLTTHDNGLRWYSISEPLPDGIGLVLCDGPIPYGRGRYGVLPLVRPYLAPGAVILFDDAAAEGQPEVLEDWAREFGAHVEQKHDDGVSYAIVRVP
jgi:predicted O-methyltransferase YrrM